MIYRVLASLPGTLLLVAVAVAQSEFDPEQIAAGELDPQLVEQGWVLLTKRGVPPTRFRFAGDATIAVDTNLSNALIFRELDKNHSVNSLSWEWRVDTLTTGAKVGADPDWPIAVYAAFEVDKQYIGWWRRVMNRLTFSAAGLPSSGKILTYTWSPAEQADAQYPNPYIPRTGMIRVLEGAQSEQGAWVTEQRDLNADFEAAFGHPAERVLFIAISADGEDTRAVSKAAIRNIRILP